MKTEKTIIRVYLHRENMTEAKFMGILRVQQAKGRTSYSFEYDTDWLKSKERLLLDPGIQWYGGPQYPTDTENYGFFLDSMPDTWGRTLMKRKAAQEQTNKTATRRSLSEIDFLLGVYDKTRMGALRLKTEENGPFLADCETDCIPPWSWARELEAAVQAVESDKASDEIKKELALLLAPGSSLGGARPKANVADAEDNIWIAKFPSKNDTVDKAAWEYLTYILAKNAGIKMAECKIEKLGKKHHTFFTKRFDRNKEKRIHFASAMTMTGMNEEKLRFRTASYLDIAEFIQYSGMQAQEDLKNLWKRMVFSIAVSNTDDHLRNHGFLLRDKGWVLSPAYDINPSPDTAGLSLNIDTENNALDFDLALSVSEYFNLKSEQANEILEEVKQAVSNWKRLAVEIGISRNEIEMMEPAFNK